MSHVAPVCSVTVSYVESDVFHLKSSVTEKVNEAGMKNWNEASKNFKWSLFYLYNSLTNKSGIFFNKQTNHKSDQMHSV